MPSTPLVIVMTVSSCLPSLAFLAFFPLCLCPPGSVSPALLSLPGCSPMLSGPPVLTVTLSPFTMVGRNAASPPALLVPVPVASMVPVAVPVLARLSLYMSLYIS